MKYHHRVSLNLLDLILLPTRKKKPPLIVLKMTTPNEHKRPHVPKFGDWNNKQGDHVPYTAVFDKARKGKLKDGVVKIMNPNDPEENPEAFTVVEKERGKLQEGVVKIKLPVVAENNGEGSSEFETVALPRSSHIARSSHHRPRKSDESEISLSSEKLSFECNTSSLILQQRRQQRLLDRSERKKSVDASSMRFGTDSSSSKRFGMDSSSKRFGILDSSSKRFGSSRHHRKHSSITDIDMIPIPKFGDWDESDPKSGEDFSFKFNKVKEENKNISEMFSAALSSDPNGVNTDNHEKSFSISKICCFHIFPRGRA